MTWNSGFTAGTLGIRQASQSPGCHSGTFGCSHLHVWLLLPVTAPLTEGSTEAHGEGACRSAHGICLFAYVLDIVVNEKAQKSLVLWLHYLCSCSKESAFPLATCPGPSRAGVGNTKKTALSGVIYGPFAGVPSVSSRPGSSDQVLLRSRPWEGHQRSDKMMFSLSVTPLLDRPCLMGSA